MKKSQWFKENIFPLLRKDQIEALRNETVNLHELSQSLTVKITVNIPPYIISYINLDKLRDDIYNSLWCYFILKKEEF